MKHNECEGVCLEFGCSGCAGEEKVEDRMDKNGAEVFEDEGCSPCYLRSCNGYITVSKRERVKQGRRGSRATHLCL